MSNPWLGIPLEDYEGHMAAAHQLSVLSDLFGEALMVRRPSSVVVLGVAGGNGLERIDGNLTHRVVGIDIHPQYLDAVRARFCELQGLELLCADLAHEKLHVEAVDLVHAALIFEHAGVEQCLENALSLVGTNGALSVVLQLPGEVPQVSETAVASIQTLKEEFCLIDSHAMHALLHQRGLEAVWESQRQTPEGKRFWLGIFSAPEFSVSEECAETSHECGCGEAH